MKKMIHKNRDGFTLAELLIVVAIIAVLVAVSIPIFTRQLEKARESTDIANMRAAKAAFISAYLNGSFEKDGFNGSCYYDAQKGVLVEDPSIIGNGTYGKGTTLEIPANKDAFPGYLTEEDYTDAIIVCVYNEDGTMAMGWTRGEDSGYIGLDSGLLVIDPKEDIFSPDQS